MNGRALLRQMRALTVSEGRPPISTPDDARCLVLGYFPEIVEQEHLVAVALDVRHRFIDGACITSGGLTQNMLPPNVLFRWALTRNQPCAAIVVAHNHPSGDPTPSMEDYTATTRLVSLGVVLGITVLDHIVIAGHRYTSLRESGGWKDYLPCQ